MKNNIFLPLRDEVTDSLSATKHAKKNSRRHPANLTDYWIAAKLARLKELRTKLTVSTKRFGTFPYAWGWPVDGSHQDIGLYLSIAIAEQEIRDAATTSITSHSAAYAKELSKLRKVVIIAKRVIHLVCSGLLKLGAPLNGISLNFLAGFLFPQPRSDAIYA